MLSVSLQLLEPAQLLDLQTAVFLPPAIVGLFTDPQFTQDFCNRLSLGDAYLGLTEMTEDLFCRVTLSGHKAPFLSHTLTPGMATIQGGQGTPVDHRRGRRAELGIGYMEVLSIGFAPDDVPGLEIEPTQDLVVLLPRESLDGAVRNHRRRVAPRPPSSRSGSTSQEAPPEPESHAPRHRCGVRARTANPPERPPTAP